MENKNNEEQKDKCTNDALGMNIYIHGGPTSTSYGLDMHAHASSTNYFITTTF
jgi:hypothetical protein